MTKIEPQVQITDESYDSGAAHRYRLFMQITDERIVYTVLNNSGNKFILLREYAFNTSEAHAVIEEIISSNEYISGVKYKEVIVSVASPKTTLVPSPFYNPDHARKLIEFNHTLQPNDLVYTNYVRAFDLYNVFAVKKELIDLLKAHLSHFNLLHSATPLMEGIYLEYRNITLPGLFINVNSKSFELVVTNGKQLLFYNNFKYDTTEDFIYYILFVSEQLLINPELNPVTFFSNVRKESALYNMLYKYFRNVSFADRLEQYDYHYEFEKISCHTYFSLFSQALCGS